MTDPLDEEIDGSTSLTEEELEQLIPSYITLRHELNEAEQVNILAAEEWAFRRKRDVLFARFHHRLVWIHSYPNGNGRLRSAATFKFAPGELVEPSTIGLKDSRLIYQVFFNQSLTVSVYCHCARKRQ